MESGRVVVKRFRQRSSGVASDLPVPEVAQEPAQHSQPSALDQVPTLPVQALTQDSAEQSQPPALAQGAQAPAPLEESPLSLQSWSLVQLDVPSCSARQLFLDDDDLEAAANPLQAAGHLPRELARLPNTLFFARLLLPCRALLLLPCRIPDCLRLQLLLCRCPACAAASAYDRGPRHRLEAAASGEPRSLCAAVGWEWGCGQPSGAAFFYQSRCRPLPLDLAKRAASPTADTAFKLRLSRAILCGPRFVAFGPRLSPWLLALSPFLQELESRPNQQELWSCFGRRTPRRRSCGICSRFFVCFPCWRT